jgi:uncharacterized protein
MSIEIDNRTVIDEALIQEVTQRIVEKFHPEKVILFGSHARGDARPDSDLDLIVVMQSDKPMLQRMLEVDSIFGFRRWAMDVIVYTPEEFERGSHDVGLLPYLIKGESRELYAKR